MGSEGPSVVTVHVTGFKKFHGVSENPTETIVSNLKAYMQKCRIPEGLILGSCTVLEAAGEGALAELYKVLESAVAARDSECLNPGRVIWLHLGVNSGATKFAIENQAVNEATFRCPDELGWKPQRIPIISADGGITRIREILIYVAPNTIFALHFDSKTLRYYNKNVKAFLRNVPCQLFEFVSSVLTSLPVDDIAKALAKKGYNVIPSDDAGRFVCNYVYYHSLSFSEQRRIKSLFVHVPLFSTINEDVQMQFVASLLEVLASSK